MSEIRVSGLQKRYGAVRALDGVDFTFPESRVTCLLGPSGCGKTTLMRIVAGLEKPNAGEVYFGARRVTPLPPRKRDIGMVFQYPVVYHGITVRQNIELPLKSLKLSRTEREQRVREVVEILRLGEALDRPADRLDNGTRQRVAVARAVARQPQILLFDEPITNVDPDAKLQLKRAFKGLTRRLAQTIVYVTHDQTEAMTLADQIALMRDGRIVQCAPPRELYDHPSDQFGGWFLGNPGMSFWQGTLTTDPEGGRRVESAVFPRPLPVDTQEADGAVTIGIRPEQIVVSGGDDGVPARVVRKTMTIGHQYLVQLAVGEEQIKAKIAHPVGRSLAVGDTVGVAMPVEQLTLFGTQGERIGTFQAPRGISASER